MEIKLKALSETETEYRLIVTVNQRSFVALLSKDKESIKFTEALSDIEHAVNVDRHDLGEALWDLVDYYLG